MRTLLEIGLSNAILATLLAVAVAVLTRLCRRPAVSHGLWLLVLLKLLTPPLWTVPLPWPTARAVEEELATAAPSAQTGEETAPFEMVLIPAPQQTLSLPPGVLDLAQLLAEPQQPESSASPPTTSPPAPQPVEAATGSLDWTWPLWADLAAPLWLGSAALWLAWTGLNVYRFQRLLRYARQAPRSLQDEVNNLARRLGLTNSPTLWLLPGAISPMLWAVGGSPRLLFPVRLLDQLDPEQRTTLFAHELAHLRRRDHWVRFVEVLVQGLYWWHPVVWWARHELREAEEQCCDAWVVSLLLGADRVYATALLQTVAFFSHARSPLPVVASGIGQVRQLRRRLIMILQGNTPRSLSRIGLLAMVGLGLLLLPVSAQSPKGGDETDRKIEELKRALRELEAQKRAESDGKGAAEKKAHAAEIEKAQAEAAALGKEVEAKQRALQEAQGRHQKAVARLAKLQGSAFAEFVITQDGSTNRYVYRVDNVEPRNVAPLEINKVAPKLEINNVAPKLDYFITRPVEAKVVIAGVERKVTNKAANEKPVTVTVSPDSLYVVPAGPVNVAPAKAKLPSADKRADELEKKLDRLFRELEELRRELRQNKTPRPAD
jgi:beta-lactamase regulating signal transducer with metallopeptidase domain